MGRLLLAQQLRSGRDQIRLSLSILCSLITRANSLLSGLSPVKLDQKST